MKKLIFIICFFWCAAHAEGPLFRHKEPEKQQEFENVYKDLRSVGVSSNGTDAKCIDNPTFCVDFINNQVEVTTQTVSDRMAIGGNVIISSTGVQSPTNYRLSIQNGDLKVAGTDRGTIYVERTSGAPSGGGGSHIKILQGVDWAPGNVSTQFNIRNSSNGYVGFRADLLEGQPDSSRGSASLFFSGDGPSSGWFPGYNGQYTGIVLVGGGAGTLSAQRCPGIFRVETSSLAIGTGINTPVDFFVADIKVGQFISSGLNFPDGFGVVGLTNGNTSSTGLVGEYKSSATTAATNFPSSGVWGDIGTITLTAGQWVMGANLIANLNGATISGNIMFGIYSTSGNTGGGTVAAVNRQFLAAPTSVYNSGGNLGGYEVNNTTTQTYYLKYYADYSAGTPQARGKIYAQRIR